MSVLYDGCRHRLPKGVYFKLALKFGGFKYCFCMRTEECSWDFVIDYPAVCAMYIPTLN